MVYPLATRTWSPTLCHASQCCASTGYHDSAAMISNEQNGRHGRELWFCEFTVCSKSHRKPWLQAHQESSLCECLRRVASYQGTWVGSKDGVLKIRTSSGLHIVLPATLWAVAFGDAHGSIKVGHLRTPQTLAHLQRHWWWPQMRLTVIYWVRNCQNCGSRKARPTRVIASLRSVEIGGLCDR